MALATNVAEVLSEAQVNFLDKREERREPEVLCNKLSGRDHRCGQKWEHLSYLDAVNFEKIIF